MWPFSSAMSLKELRAYSAKLKAEGASQYDYEIRRSGLRMPPEQDLLVSGQRFIRIKGTGVKDPAYYRSFQPGLHEFTVMFTGELDEHGERKRQRLWMSDTPQEISMMRIGMSDLLNVRDTSQWNVLVLGLGLGIFPQLIEKKVARVTVVEIDPLVVRAVWDHVKGPNWDLVLADAWNIDKVLRPGSFDACYMDIWEDICESNKEEYMRLKKVARRAGSRRTIGWVEDHVYGRAEYF